MHAFDYHRPASLEEARLVHRAKTDPAFLAGGQSLLPVLKAGLAAPSDLIDLARVPELTGIDVDGDALRIGAMATHAEVAASDATRERVPALAGLAESIGDPAVRHRGTLGGSIANNDPAADYPAALVALGATITTDRRDLAAEAFFTGLFETALDAGEIVVSIRLPCPDAAGYAKVRNPASRYAVAGVFVARTGMGPRVAVIGAGPCVFRHKTMEEALASDFSPAVLDGIETDARTFNDDPHASAAYRAHLVGVLAKRAVSDCATS